MKMKWMCVLALTASGLMAQDGPDGVDINSAIPIWFGQKVNDIIDSSLKPIQVYSIPLARGQKFSATVRITSAAACVALNLFPPSQRSAPGNDFNSGSLAQNSVCAGNAITWNYEVAVAGTYFVGVQAYNGSTGIKYELQVTSEGTPLLTALPTKAGCVAGQVDSITYSLRLLALNLPDEVVIGGITLCSSCAVKAPIYSQMVDKLESALKTGINVEACHDSQGQLFQVKLQR